MRRATGTGAVQASSDGSLFVKTPLF